MGRKQRLKEIVYSFLEGEGGCGSCRVGGGGAQNRAQGRTWVQAQLRACEHQPYLSVMPLDNHGF